MALATQCPHCGTQFRVAADQLKLRGGIVRCGACQKIFDGNSSLIELAPTPVPAPPAPSVLPAPPTPEAEPPAPGEVPVYTLDLERTFGPLGIAPETTPPQADPAAPAEPPAGTPDRDPDSVGAAPEAAPEVAPEAAPEPISLPELELDLELDLDLEFELELELETESGPPSARESTPESTPESRLESTLDSSLDSTLDSTLDSNLDSNLDSTPELDFTPDPEATREHPVDADGPPTLLLRESAADAPVLASTAPVLPRNRAAEARARRLKAAPPQVEAPPTVPKVDLDEPEFVRSTRQRQASGKMLRGALAAASVLLLLALVLQAALTFRDELAARYPALRPALVSACDLLGCRITLPARPEQLVIETGELITLGGNAYTLSTVLRNQGDMALAWPSIELTLNDADERPLVRRVFGPRDYAGAAAAAPTGLGAHAEQPVRIHFRLEGIEPSGYHIAVFYP